jgi:hypothetical protein
VINNKNNKELKVNNIKKILKRRENLDTIFSVFSEGNTVSKEGVFGAFENLIEVIETKRRLEKWISKTGRTLLIVSLGCDEEDDSMSWNVVKRDFFNISKKRLNDCKKDSLIESFEIKKSSLDVVVNVKVLIDELMLVKTDAEVESLISEMTSDIALLENSLGFEIGA